MSITFWEALFDTSNKAYLNGIKNHKKTSIARQTVKFFEIFPYRNTGLFISQYVISTRANGALAARWPNVVFYFFSSTRATRIFFMLK